MPINSVVAIRKIQRLVKGEDKTILDIIAEMDTWCGHAERALAIKEYQIAADCLAVVRYLLSGGQR